MPFAFQSESISVRGPTRRPCAESLACHGAPVLTVSCAISTSGPSGPSAGSMKNTPPSETIRGDESDQSDHEIPTELREVAGMDSVSPTVNQESYSAQPVSGPSAMASIGLPAQSERTHWPLQYTQRTNGRLSYTRAVAGAYVCHRYLHQTVSGTGRQVGRLVGPARRRKWCRHSAQMGLV